MTPQGTHATFATQASCAKAALLVLIMAVALLGTAGCAAESEKASLTRIASKLRPTDVQVVASKPSDPSKSPEQADAQGVVTPELIRTSAPDWQIRYELAHSVLSRPEYQKDVSPWGVRIVLKDESSQVVDTFQQVGLSGLGVVNFRGRQGRFTAELSAHEFSSEGPQVQLGETTVYMLFRDTQAPRTALTVTSVEDLQTKLVTFKAQVVTQDEDDLPPVCKGMELLTANDTVVKTTPTAFDGTEWKQDNNQKVWQVAVQADVDLFGALPVSARLDCTDRTGNTSAVVVALAGAQRTEIQPQLAVAAVGRSLTAVPRFAKDGIERTVLLENRSLSLTLSLVAGGALITDPEVVNKKRGELTMLVEARSALASAAEPARVVWSGVPEGQKIIEIPASLIGAVDLKFTISDSLAPADSSKADLLSAWHKVYVSPVINPSVQSKLEFIQPADLIPAIKDFEVVVLARAVLDGLPFANGDFPNLEYTEDGSTWQLMPGAAFALSRAEAPATGAEGWSIRFAYPFADERPLRLRLRGVLKDGTERVSNVSRRVFGAPLLAETLPELASSARSLCAQKSKLVVQLASGIACTTRDSSNVRLLLAIENHGSAPFVLSSVSTLGGAVDKVPLGFVAYRNAQSVLSGFVPGTEATLNEKGLMHRAIVAIDLPKTYLDGGSNLFVNFDQQTTGGHSLEQGNYCYQSLQFPKVTLKQNSVANVRVAPFVCEDEF
jgi:hypothetical protein